MKPCLLFAPEGDHSSLSSLAAAMDQVWPEESKFKAAMKRAVAEHIAKDDEDALNEIKAKLSAWNRLWHERESQK